MFCFFRALVVVGCALLLAACNSIEHRSEAVPKKPLKELDIEQLSPSLMWSSSEGQGVQKRDDKLRLAVTREAVITADSKGVLRAQNNQNGRVLWSIKTGSSISSGPTVIDGIVFVGTRDKEFAAFDAASGKLLWQVPMTGEVLAAPNASRGTLFVHALDGTISALNMQDGKLLWRHGFITPPIVLRHASRPAVVGNQVLVGFSNGRLISFHQNDGSPNWERELAIPRGRSDIQRMTDIAADPIVHNGIAYAVSYQGRLAAINISTGLPIWEKDISSYSGLDFSAQNIFISDAKGHILNINGKTGKTLWEQDALEGRRLSKPTVYGNTIVVGDEDGNLHWLSANDGALLSRRLIDKKGIEAQPILLNDTLYVLGRGGKVAAYKLSNRSTPTTALDNINNNVNDNALDKDNGNDRALDKGKININVNDNALDTVNDNVNVNGNSGA